MGVELVARVEAGAGDEDGDFVGGLGQAGVFDEGLGEVPGGAAELGEVQHGREGADEGAVVVVGDEAFQVFADLGLHVAFEGLQVGREFGVGQGRQAHDDSPGSARLNAVGGVGWP